MPRRRSQSPRRTRGQDRERDAHREQDRSRRDRGGHGRSRSRYRGDRGGRGGGDRGGRRRSRSRSRSRSRRASRRAVDVAVAGPGGESTVATAGATAALAVLGEAAGERRKKKSGWDEPPPGMNTGPPALLALPAPGGADVAVAKPLSSIQAALEAQKKMLAAKAAAATIQVVPPPMPVSAMLRPPAPPPEVVDPAITLAIAKAKAAALKTCTGDGAATRPSAIENARALLRQSSAAVASFPQVKLTAQLPLPKPVTPLALLRPSITAAGSMEPGSPGAQVTPRSAFLQQVLGGLAARPHLNQGAALAAPGLASPIASKALGTVVRPPPKMGAPGASPLVKVLPLLTPTLGPASTTSKAPSPLAGWAPVGATAKQAPTTVPPPVPRPLLGFVNPSTNMGGRSLSFQSSLGSLGDLAAMKEVSPALAALMQGGLV